MQLSSRALLPVAVLLVAGCSSDLSTTGTSGSETEDPVTIFTDHTSAPRSALASTQGQWSSVFPWVNVSVHLTVLPDGRVLSFGRLNGGVPQVWDPSNGQFTSIPSPSLLFCAGQAYLSGGRLFVAGGHIQDGFGLPNANMFSWRTNSWIPAPAMQEGRWYPTATTLGNGDVLVIAGTNENGQTVMVPEVWNGTNWRRLTGASRSVPYFPRDFLAPNGQVFYAGEMQQTSYLNPVGTGSWTYVADRVRADRYYGAAVMYRPGKVLYAGGGDPPTATAEVIDLNAGSPQWTATGSMVNARQQLNLTMLPDGRVLATGGTSAAGFSNPAGGVHDAEVWDPATGHWNTWSANAVTRVYHSGTILLPDGRLVHSGSGDGAGLVNESDAEIFEPPYLFNGARPTIASVPGVVDHGQTVTLTTPDAADISLVSLVRLNSTTHAHDMNQRWLKVDFTRNGNDLSLKIPVGRNKAPPGHYMLFILNGAKVPSVARIVRIR